MQEARSTIAAETDVASLRSRIAQLSTERDALFADLGRDRLKLQESQAQLAEWLGKAAQKSPGNATATATATGTGNGNGKAGSEGGATMEARGFGVPFAASTAAPRSARTSSPASKPAPNPTPGSAPNSTDGSTTTEASTSTATSEPPQASGGYIRKPTPSRTIAEPSSSRRSTDCSR
jgi:hypothetical protein